MGEKLSNNDSPLRKTINTTKSHKNIQKKRLASFPYTPPPRTCHYIKNDWDDRTSALWYAWERNCQTMILPWEKQLTHQNRIKIFRKNVWHHFPIHPLPGRAITWKMIEMIEQVHYGCKWYAPTQPWKITVSVTKRDQLIWDCTSCCHTSHPISSSKL